MNICTSFLLYVRAFNFLQIAFLFCKENDDLSYLEPKIRSKICNKIGRKRAQQ